MNEPLVSVIVPTIGRPQFFQRAIASVAAQTYGNLEIFVSDNAAEPAITEEEVRASCGGRPFRLVRRVSRLDFTGHFNTCLREASGHYAMFLSDDDLLVPRFVETAVACFESDPQIGAVMSKQTRIDETFSELPRDEALSWTVALTEETFLQWFRDRPAEGPMTFVTLMGRRREMLEAGGFGDYPSGTCSDLELLLGLTLEKKLGILSGGFLYRVYASSVGLGMPWGHLWKGVNAFETRLNGWVKNGRMHRGVHQAILRSHTTVMIGRYRKLYWSRKGFGNRVTPFLSIVYRVGRNLLKYGPATAPLLHRLYRRAGL